MVFFSLFLLFLHLLFIIVVRTFGSAWTSIFIIFLVFLILRFCYFLFFFLFSSVFRSFWLNVRPSVRPSTLFCLIYQWNIHWRTIRKSDQGTTDFVEFCIEQRCFSHKILLWKILWQRTTSHWQLGISSALAVWNTSRMLRWQRKSKQKGKMRERVRDEVRSNNFYEFSIQVMRLVFPRNSFAYFPLTFTTAGIADLRA